MLSTSKNFGFSCFEYESQPEKQLALYILDDNPDPQSFSTAMYWNCEKDTCADFNSLVNGWYDCSIESRSHEVCLVTKVVIKNALKSPICRSTMSDTEEEPIPQILRKSSNTFFIPANSTCWTSTRRRRSQICSNPQACLHKSVRQNKF